MLSQNTGSAKIASRKAPRKAQTFIFDFSLRQDCRPKSELAKSNSRSYLDPQPSSLHLTICSFSPWYTSTLTPVGAACGGGTALATRRIVVCAGGGAAKPLYSARVAEEGTSSGFVSRGLRSAS